MKVRVESGWTADGAPRVSLTKDEREYLLDALPPGDAGDAEETCHAGRCASTWRWRSAGFDVDGAAR